MTFTDLYYQSLHYTCLNRGHGFLLSLSLNMSISLIQSRLRIVSIFQVHLVSGGFDHILGLCQLETLEIDGFWAVFEDLPPKIALSENLQEKLGHLRERLEASAEPLL